MSYVGCMVYGRASRALPRCQIRTRGTVRSSGLLSQHNIQRFNVFNTSAGLRGPAVPLVATSHLTPFASIRIPLAPLQNIRATATPMQLCHLLEFGSFYLSSDVETAVIREPYLIRSSRHRRCIRGAASLATRCIRCPLPTSCPYDHADCPRSTQYSSDRCRRLPLAAVLPATVPDVKCAQISRNCS